jgi:hypothetical protein
LFALRCIDLSQADFQLPVPVEDAAGIAVGDRYDLAGVRRTSMADRPEQKDL